VIRVPLKAGKKAVSSNISEMMNKFDTAGTIGTSKPKSRKKAEEQAEAAALNKAGLSKKKRGKKRASKK
jgi:hypothetical protein